MACIRSSQSDGSTDDLNKVQNNKNKTITQVGMRSLLYHVSKCTVGYAKYTINRMAGLFSQTNFIFFQKT